MDVYVCWDGDKIGRRVGRAVLGNDVGEVRRVDQAINAGNELWRNYAVNNGGSIIEIGGDEGRISVDASKLAGIPQVADQYAQTVGATVSVGIGMKLSESAQALMVAKLRGGNHTLVWDKSMQPEYDQAANPTKTETDKLHEEYLGKAANGTAAPKTQTAGGEDVSLVLAHNTKKLTGPNAGFSVQHKPGFTDQKPSQAAGAPESASDPSAPAPQMSSSSSSSPDFEGQLHDAAQGQSVTDAQSSDASKADNDQLKKKLTDALKKIRENLPLIAQIQQRSPEAYKAILGLVQGVIVLGKQFMSAPTPDEEPQHMKEALGKAEEPLEKTQGMPTFPKLGLGDNRRETPIISTQGELKTKTASMNAHAARVEPTAARMTPEQAGKSAAGYTSTVPGSRVSYSLDNSLREAHGMSGPHVSQFSNMIHQHPNAPLATQEHENFHMMMNRVQEKYGPEARKTLARGLYHSIPDVDRKAVDTFTGARSPMHPSHPYLHEEKLAVLHNYLNNPGERQAFHTYFKNTPEQAQAFDSAIKRAHRRVQEVAQTVDEKYLMPPTMKSEMSAESDECPKCGHKEFIPHKDGSKTCKGCFKDYSLAKGDVSGELQMAAAELPSAGSPEDKRALKLPMGALVDGKVKVKHSDGTAGWKQVQSGMIQAQDPGVPLYGANSHPVSSREPSSN